MCPTSESHGGRHDDLHQPSRRSVPKTPALGRTARATLISGRRPSRQTTMSAHRGQVATGVAGLRLGRSPVPGDQRRAGCAGDRHDHGYSSAACRKLRARDCPVKSSCRPRDHRLVSSAATPLRPCSIWCSHCWLRHPRPVPGITGNGEPDGPHMFFRDGEPIDLHGLSRGGDPIALP